MKNKFSFLLIGLILITIFVHFLWLDRFPVGLSHDEIEYILSSRQYFRQGTDLSGIGFPLSIIKTDTVGIISFLPSLILSPYYGLVPLNLATARLPYIFLNLISAYLIYLIAQKIFHRQLPTLLAVLLFLINPWSFYLSRTATDTPFALLFTLLGIYWTINPPRQKIYPLFLAFLAMFFSYHGAKIIFLPLVLSSLLYHYFYFRQPLKKYLLWAVLSLLIPLLYFLAAIHLPGSVINHRMADFLLPSSPTIGRLVNDDRRLAIANKFMPVFSNKFQVYFGLIAQKYLSAFSPDILFISGDPRATYRFGQFGLFYLFDLIFIFMGAYFFIKKHRLPALYFISLIVVAPLPTAISTVETSIINRSFLLLPSLILFITFGFSTILSFFSSCFRFAKPLLLFLYIFSFASFAYFYFFRFPVIAQENYFYSQRLLASYLTRIDSDRSVVIVASEPRQLYLESLIFYPVTSTTKLIFGPSYQINNIIFTGDCPSSIAPDTTYFIENSFDRCPALKLSSLAIKNEQYLTPLFYLVNDFLCQSSPHSAWINPRLLSDYDLPRLSTGQFCSRWLMSL